MAEILRNRMNPADAIKNIKRTCQIPNKAAVRAHPILARTSKGSVMIIDYLQTGKVIASLTDGETDDVAKMATVVCELHHADDRFDWTGFYRVTEPSLLKIGPYQGGHGCLAIPFDKGVCGAAARSGQIQLIDDVLAFEGHIACASSTRSEIVLPVRNGAGELLGVLDIDSDQPSAFTQDDAQGLANILHAVFAKP